MVELVRSQAAQAKQVEVAPEVETAAPSKGGAAKKAKQNRGKEVQAGDAGRTKGARSKGATKEDFAGLDAEGRKLLGSTLTKVESTIRDVETLKDTMDDRVAKTTQAGTEGQAKFEEALTKLREAQGRAKAVTDKVSANQAALKQALNWKPASKEEAQKKRGMFSAIAETFGFGKQKEAVVVAPSSMEAVLNEGSEMTVDIFFEVKTARDVLESRKSVLEGAIRVTSNDRKLAVKDYSTFGIKLVEFADLIDAKRAEQKAIVDIVGEENAKLTPEHAELEDQIVKLDQYQQWVGRRMAFFRNAIESYDSFLNLANELQITSRGMITNADELLQTTALEQRSQDQIAAIVGALAKVAELSNNLRVALAGNKENARQVLQYATGEYAQDYARTQDLHTVLRGIDKDMLDTAQTDNAIAEKARRQYVDQTVAQLRQGLTIKDRTVHLAPDARPVADAMALSERVKRIDNAMRTIDHGGQPTHNAGQVAKS